VGNVENEKRLRDDLHPGADRRRSEPDPQQPKVAVTERSERSTAGSRRARTGGHVQEVLRVGAVGDRRASSPKVGRAIGVRIRDGDIDGITPRSRSERSGGHLARTEDDRAVKPEHLDASRRSCLNDHMLLYGNTMWTSPYVLSCFVALREKGLPFEVRTVALDVGAQHEPAFAKQSITSRVPVLVDGDWALSESSAIVEYLEEAYPPPAHAAVLPADVPSRARARQIMAWVRSDLLALREERPTSYVFHPHAAPNPLPALSPAAERAAAKLLRAAEQFVPASGGPLFGNWCVADTDLAMMLQRLVKTGHPLPARIRAYAEAQWERPAIREFCSQERPPFAPAML
jgi:glutathione S-transferase